MEYNLVATTTFGLEGITAKELKALGYEDLKVENGKVFTIEGNSKDEVREKSYNLSSKSIYGYGV